MRNAGWLDKQDELATDKQNTGVNTLDNGEDELHLEGGGDHHKDR
jgi:hypothetical protein